MLDRNISEESGDKVTEGSCGIELDVWLDGVAICTTFDCGEKPCVPEAKEFPLQKAAHNKHVCVEERPFPIDGDHEGAAGFKDAPYLARNRINIWNVVENAKGINGVEISVWERDGTGVGLAKIYAETAHGEVSGSKGEVLIGDVDAVAFSSVSGELNEISAVPDAYLEDSLSFESVEPEVILLPRLLPVALGFDREEVVKGARVSAHSPAGMGVPLSLSLSSCFGEIHDAESSAVPSGMNKFAEAF